MEQKDMYTLRELFEELGIPIAELGRRSGISEVTVAKIRDGKSARRSTVVNLLRVLSDIHGVKLSLANVSGVIINDKLARSASIKNKDSAEKVEKQPAPAPVKNKPAAEKPQKRKYKPREVDLPEGCILASKFAEQHGVPRPTFTHHMLIGLGPGTVPGEQGDPMLPVKEQVDYSERDHPSRKGERERYLTPAQQTSALDFWKRHGVAFTIPESEQGAPADEHWWTEPGAE